MTAYVAFLRAVNVGGKNKVPMARLRDALAAAGLEEIATVLQSGNVVFRSRASAGCRGEGRRRHDRGDLRPPDRGGDPVGCGARRSRGDQSVPRRRSPTETRRRSTSPFSRARPSAAAVAKLDPDRSPPDSFAVSGREIYLSYPDGSGRSRLTLDYLEKTLGVTGTARNWRTVQRLATLLEG